MQRKLSAPDLLTEKRTAVLYFLANITLISFAQDPLPTNWNKFKMPRPCRELTALNISRSDKTFQRPTIPNPHILRHHFYKNQKVLNIKDISILCRLLYVDVFWLVMQSSPTNEVCTMSQKNVSVQGYISSWCTWPLAYKYELTVENKPLFFCQLSVQIFLSYLPQDRLEKCLKSTK